MEVQVVFIQNPNRNVNWEKNEKNGLILKMNFTLTESNILGKKDAEVDFDSICTNTIIDVYIL